MRDATAHRWGWVDRLRPFSEMDNLMFVTATLSLMLTIIISAAYTIRTLRVVGVEAQRSHQLLIQVLTQEQGDQSKRREAFQDRLDGLDRTIGALKMEIADNQATTEELRQKFAERPAAPHRFGVPDPAAGTPAAAPRTEPPKP